MYDTTRAALEGFARFVPPGGFFVVEDGCVDDEELRFDEWPRGVLPAVARLAGDAARAGSSRCAATWSCTGSPATPRASCSAGAG